MVLALLADPVRAHIRHKKVLIENAQVLETSDRRICLRMTKEDDCRDCNCGSSPLCSLSSVKVKVKADVRPPSTAGSGFV